MLNPARQYLIVRSLGAPAVLLSLAMQGVFRGFKDTKTPLYATGMVWYYATGLFSSFIWKLLSSIGDFQDLAYQSDFSDISVHMQ